MSTGTYPITGIPLDSSGNIPTRQEVTSWFDNDDNKYQVSLFMQALQQFMILPITERLSYFQIAGIHCYPVVDWDGEPQKQNPGDPFPGYCNHNMVTFPTWHRPYMLLYEQILYNIMYGEKGGLIQSWIDDGTLSDKNEQQLWISAATQFRLPYWDWARKQAYEDKFIIPKVCTLDTVKIVMPGGKTNPNFPNPLVRFQNPGNIPMGENKKPNNIQDDPDGELPWSRCIGTSRYGINTDNPDSTWVQGVNDWKQVNLAMADPLWYGQDGGSFTDAVGRMLSPGYFDSWEPFASTAHNNPQTNNKASHFLSLEYIHNVVHTTCGGSYKSAAAVDPNSLGYKGVGLGHMSDVPVAAFDPIFWFHHCNIDRLMAIWQTLNWEKWFDTPQKSDPPSDGPLRPFHQDEQKTLWTSDHGKDWTTLNYQYDDLVVQPGAIDPDGTVNKKRHHKALREHLQKLYPNTRMIVSDIPGYVKSNNKFHDYVINVIYDRYALNGSAYSILFFLGDPPANLSGYREDPNFVGLVYTFSTPIMNDETGSPSCGNCATQKAKKVLSKAQVSLTLPLLAKLSAPPPTGARPIPGWPSSGVGELTPETVELLLQQLLKVRFVQLGGRERPRSDFPNTEIKVLAGEGSVPGPAISNDEETRVFGRYKVLPLATATEENMAGLSTSLGLIRDDSDA